MRRAPTIFAALCAVLLAALARDARGADPKWSEREASVRKALRAEDAKERARAFDPLQETDDARAVDLVIEGVRTIRDDQEKIAKSQATTEQSYEKALDDQEKNRKQYESSNKSARDLDRYNANERKISKNVNAALASLKDFENDFARTRSQLDNATLALRSVLPKLAAEDLTGAVAKIEAAWLRSKHPDDPILFIDAIAALDFPWVGERLRAVVSDATVPLGVRGAALTTLGGRKDVALHGLATAWLALPPEQFVGIAAAIEALRVRHDTPSIEPLIAFLQREDVKRLREDAHRALISLTGQQHGPYFQPWDAWWRDAKATFVMPETPKPRLTAQQKGNVTFYGIHTFSDRILFVLDVSGSMEQASKPGPDGAAGGPRIDVARKEITGAIGSMNDGDRFSVILFNHSVLQWQQRMAEANEATKKQAIRWVETQLPTGGTNIHDALETAFQLAYRITGRPDIDTIMFMTDGRPTAGKVQEPKMILERVREWNRTAHLTIHCVGVGEHDEAFMAELAKIGNGEYVKR